MGPTDSVSVGPLVLPIAAGAADDPIADPVVDALADFLGWSLRHDLDAKLATLTGTSSTAVVQATHVFTFDPQHPRGHSVKRPLPALYVWWDGESRAWPVSNLVKGRKRKLRALYIFEEQPARADMSLRAGLFAAVDAIFHRASDCGGHPEYSYNSKPVGTPLKNSTDVLGWDWGYLGGEAGSVKRIGVDDPETDVAPKRQRVSHQGFPAFMAFFETEELNAAVSTPLLTADSPADLEQDGVSMLDRTLEYDAG